MRNYVTKDKIQVMQKSVVHPERVNRQLVFMLLAILFFYGLSVRAAGAAEIKKMSLAQAVKIALTYNQDVKLSKNDVAYATLALEKEKNDYLPQVTGAASTVQKNDYGQSGSDRNYYTAGAEISAQFNLFKGFEDDASRENAWHDLSSYEHAEIRQEQKVIYDTASAYLEVVKQLREIDIAQENLTTNRQQEKEIKAFHDAGKIPATDLYQQQAETAKAGLDYITAENNYKVSKMALLKTMGISGPDDVAVEMPEITIASMTPQTDICRLVEAAFQTRPDLLALEKRVSASNALIKTAASGNYPSVDLTAGMTSLYDNRYGRDFGGQFGNDNLNSYAGVSVSLPIFDRHLTRVKVSQAKVDKQSAEVTLDKLKQQIRVELGQAVADYQTACETVIVSESILLYTDNALESLYQRYKMGAANFTELSQIRSDQVEAKNNMAEAEIDRIIKLISISFYKGDLGLSHLI